MFKFSAIKSLRAKLILGSVVIEIIMLSLLVGNSIRLTGNAFVDQAQRQNDDLQPLFNAALVGPMAQRDYATLGEILKGIQSDQGLVYLVLLDNRAMWWHP